MDYNKAPYQKKFEATIKDAYEKWAPKYFETKNLSESRKKAWLEAYKALHRIHSKKLRELSAEELEIAISEASESAIMQIDVRCLLIQLYDWGMKYEIVDKNYAKLTDVIPRPAAKIERVVFSDSELDKLWKMRYMECVDMVLVGLYTGLRPGEICTLESKNVNLQERYMVGGSKTKAGINRIIPIHDKIFEIISSHIGTGRLFKIDNNNVSYNLYARRFRAIVSALDASHSPHDTRHTFITKSKQAGMDDFCLKLIVGHAINDITENVYTHRTPAELLGEINKISYDI